MAYGAPRKNQSAPRGPFSGGRERFLFLALSICASCCLVACEKRREVASAEPSSSPSAEESEEKPRAPVNSRAEVEKPEAPVPDLFLRGLRVKFEVGTELVGEVPEKFSRKGLGSYKLHLPSYGANPEIWLAIDHHAPRLARGPYFVIADLVNEDVELAPGAHFLAAFEWGKAEQQRLQLSAFFVDVAPSSLPQNPGCLLATPALTLNGRNQAKEVRFLAVPLSEGLDRIEYGLEADGLNSLGEAPPGTEIVLEDPPAGDIELSVRCFSGDEFLADDEQTVTVNPEAPELEAAP